MGSCQNYGPFWGTLNNRCRIILGTQKGTIILRTTHMDPLGTIQNLKTSFGFRAFQPQGLGAGFMVEGRAFYKDI